MGNFRRDDRSGGRRDYGQRDFQRQSFGGGGRDRQMHKTTCSNCGKDCEVPFVPTGSKPVFCSQCFDKNRSRDAGSRRFEDRSPRRPNFERNYRPQNQNNVQLETINAKLDKILEMLASPIKKRTST